MWAPVKQPEYKAIGERFFDTLNTMLFHKLKGGVPYDPKTMSALGINPSDEAVISLGELDRLIHQVIVAYQNEYHSGLDAIPARLWEGKINRHGRRFIPDIRQMNSMLGRVATGTLTRRGIKFENMVFHEEEATTALLNDMVSAAEKRSQSSKPISSAKVKVKFKYNPADASRIEVWNDGASPRQYVTLYNVSKRFTRHLSFWQIDKIREFAAEQRMALDTDEQKWAAREALREHYDRLAGKKMRDTRDARRGVAQSMGTYDDADHEIDPTKFRNADVIETASPSIASEMPAMERSDDTDPPVGFKPSQATKAQADKDRKAKKAEKDANERAEAKAQKQRQATHKPIDLGKVPEGGVSRYKAALKNRTGNWGKK